jgi:hypothetical protein
MAETWFQRAYLKGFLKEKRPWPKKSRAKI